VGSYPVFGQGRVPSNGLGLSYQGLCFLMEPVRGFLSIGFGWYLRVFHSPVNSLAASQVLPTFKGIAVVHAHLLVVVSRRSSGLGFPCTIDALMRPCEQITALKADDSVCE